MLGTGQTRVRLHWEPQPFSSQSWGAWTLIFPVEVGKALVAGNDFQPQPPPPLTLQLDHLEWAPSDRGVAAAHQAPPPRSVLIWGVSHLPDRATRVGQGHTRRRLPQPQGARPGPWAGWAEPPGQCGGLNTRVQVLAQNRTWAAPSPTRPAVLPPGVRWLAAPPSAAATGG